jgi:small multidrug resistance pump
MSLEVLSQALRKIEFGIAYAIWSAVGIALIAVSGAAVFREEITLVKVGSFALIVPGVVGLSLAGTEG